MSAVKKALDVSTQFTKYKKTVFDSGIGARLPEAYKKFYNEWKSPGQAVHYVPYTGSKWIGNSWTGEIKRKEDIPLPVMYPSELDNIFTGGEGVIQGFIKRGKFGSRIPHFWMPQAFKSVIYSEILDKYLSVLMTQRVVQLIHEHRGLDPYLLETKACDLKTLVALRLKKRILLALSEKNLPYDESKNNKIFEKYEKYIIPADELEWYGLTFEEACQKLLELEEAQLEASKIPLKQMYRTQLVNELREIGSN